MRCARDKIGFFAEGFLLSSYHASSSRSVCVDESTYTTFGTIELRRDRALAESSRDEKALGEAVCLGDAAPRGDSDSRRDVLASTYWRAPRNPFDFAGADCETEFRDTTDFCLGFEVVCDAVVVIGEFKFELSDALFFLRGG